MGTKPKTRFLFGAMLLALCAVSCIGGDGDVAIELCGDVEIPEEVTEARISILNSQREEVRAAVVDLVDCSGGEPQPEDLPQTVHFRDPGGKVWIVVQGLRNEAELLRYERRADLTGREDEFQVGLVRQCIGITCSLGQTCVRGKCERVTFEADAVPCGNGLPPEEGAVSPDSGPVCEGDDGGIVQNDSGTNNGGMQ